MSTPTGSRSRIVSALHNYVDLGLPVIPLCAHDHKGYSERHKATCNCPGKVPITKAWQTHEETTRQQVVSWIKEFGNINIGLPLGHVSGFIGIDVDGAAGEGMLEELSGGDVPDTWEFSTGAGRRLMYQIPVGMNTKKFVNTGDGDHEECSILAFGQQTVMPPSIHFTGHVYEWIDGHSPEDLDCELAPQWLLELVREDKPTKKKPGIPKDFGTLDLSGEFATHIPASTEMEEEALVINPILVSDTVLPSEFSEYHSIEIDTTPPDIEYTGKAAKSQKKEESGVTDQELVQRIGSGNRDVQMTRIIGHFCAKYRALGKDYIMFMAKNHNQTFCDPPLDDPAIEAKVTHFWESEQMKSAKFKEGAIDSDKKQFEPGTVAQVVLNNMEAKGYVLKVDPKEPIIWLTRKTVGPWRPINAGGNADELQVYIAEPLSEPELGGDPKWLTRKNFGEVANALILALRTQKRYWLLDAHNTDTQTMDAYKYIPLADGKLLDWKTGALNAWDPETHLTYTLPITFDPHVDAPNWKARMEEWLPDEGSRKIMQEFVGYSLIPYMGFEKALMIQGEGANGKSLFLETIQGLLGYEVVESINMRNLFSRFGSADLLGKILNIVNEAGADYLRGGAADEFKNLVSGGRVKADVKNKSPITFNNTAKFIFAANHDIKTGDKSEGWLRRMLIVPFDQDFTKSKTPKYEIMEELKKEYSGIFNWALEGLRRLMESKAFSISKTAERKMADYRQRNDIAADFYINCLTKFDLQIREDSGKPILSGLPSGLVSTLFESWIEYRESTVQRTKERIREYLTSKHNLKNERTKHPRFLKRSMTLCWIGLDLHITDVGFLEFLRDEPVSKYPEVKDYAIKRLEEIDASTGHHEPIHSVPTSEVMNR